MAEEQGTAPDTPTAAVAGPQSGVANAVLVGGLGSKTIEHLGEIAKDAYDQQDDLNESVWRSLPFFAAALALAVTITGRAAATVPPLAHELGSIFINAVLWAATASFMWAFRWLWSILASRDYEYPSNFDEVRTYADDMQAYHAAAGVASEQVDTVVRDELQLFRAAQLGEAAKVNLVNNARRLKARSQLLLFMMVGFILAIASQVLTFAYHLLGGGS